MLSNNDIDGILSNFAGNNHSDSGMFFPMKSAKTHRMLRNYIVVTFRNLIKNPNYSFINIAGLSIGITCSLLILLWVTDELSYDRFLPKANRLYQVWVNAKFDGKVNTWNSVPLPMYRGLKNENSNIVNTAAADWGGDHLLTVTNEGTGEVRLRKSGQYVSEEFLTMFEFEMVKGNPALALKDPSSIVITESTAKALFGDADPINQTIRLNNKDELKVSGVLKDFPPNSSFQRDAFFPWSLYEQNDWVKSNLSNWGNYSFQVYVELNDSKNQADVENKIRNILPRHGEKEVPGELFLHKLTDWRLHSNFENGKISGGMIEYVQMFTVIGVFILVIACINFMNLSTARSERRAREVGIRKSVGSSRREIILQFIGESMFISLVAFIIAIVLTQIALPFYNDLVEKKLFIDYGSSSFWLYSFGLIFFTGFVSGSYPAFYLSSFQPVKVLKGKVQVGKSASMPRKILVTAQFGFSILLIIGTLVIYQQIQLVKNRDIGYSQENLIAVPLTTEIRNNFAALKNELLGTGVVVSATRSNSTITEINSNNFLGWPGKPDDLRVIFSTIAADFDYTKTMGIKVLEGRDFSEDFKSDSSAIIINKAGLALMGLKDPIGTKLDLWGDKRELIGVVDNVLMGDPNEPIKPMFAILHKDWHSSVSVRLEKGDVKESLAKVEAVFKKYNPAYPFEYVFADQEFAKKFKTIELTSSLANVFASLAIIITGLGLFGLAAFTAEQRTKEIGIRKVLGATVPGLVGLISRDFSKLVILAFIFSAPVSWWLLDLYLNRYTLRVDIAWWIFPATGAVALAFALLIVTTQALRAAHANPATSLRSE
jgi:putative ABC transport system permease protein